MLTCLSLTSEVSSIRRNENMKQLAALVLSLCWTCIAFAQQDTAPKERRVSLGEAAIALDGAGSPALEATLLSSDIQGRPESAITNVRAMVKNSSPTSF